ncbi:MAG: DUF4331 family protein [Candidatus Eisenbacteria bacterium]
MSRFLTVPLRSFALAAALLSLPGLALASSHREAPAIAEDPVADNLDVYAFVSPNAPGTVTLIATYNGVQEPGGGPNFYKFGDEVLYQIKVSNDGDPYAEIVYNFRFNTQTRNDQTFLYNTGPINSLTDLTWNRPQTYEVFVTSEEGRVPARVLGTGLYTTPSNIGPASTPNWPALMQQAVQTVDSNIKVYAGQSDDPFFVDLGAVFDLLTIRPGAPGNAGGGIDGLGGFNCQTIAIQIPIAKLSATGALPTGTTDPNAILGVWATANRPAKRKSLDDLVSRMRGGNEKSWLQVSRLGMPLVNEIVIPLRDKDRWNASQPVDDGQFLSYVVDPEPARLLNALYGLTVPAPPRNDLVAVFLTGVEGLNKRADVVPSEMIRLNTAIAPSATPNRLGVLAGQLDGFPNGRRLVDDIVDIELRVVAGILVGAGEPNTLLGDGVDANELPFQAMFPYVAPSHSGFAHEHHAMTPVSAAHADEGAVVPASLGLVIPSPAGVNAGAAGSLSASGAVAGAALATPSVVYASTNGGAKIRFAQPAAGPVSFRIYNVRGQIVRTLLNETREAGEHLLAWDGADDAGARVAAGMYFYRGEVGGARFDQKLVMVK